MARETVSHAETVLVEQSDGRLAAAEYAKRTGEPFVSVSSEGTEVVPHDVAAAIAEDKSMQNTYVGARGRTYAAQLESFHAAIDADPNFVQNANEEKAQAHHEYSAVGAAKRQEEDVRNKVLQAEGYDFSLAVQQANLERAREYEGKASDYVDLRTERDADAKGALAVSDESIEVINNEDLALGTMRDRASALHGVARRVPVALEAQAEDSLIVKDNIVSLEEKYKAHAAPHETLRPKDAPSNDIVANASSPEELVESTKLAQLAAGNITTEATEVVEEMQDTLAPEQGEEVTSKPGEFLPMAEEKVSKRGRTKADELVSNPNPESL